jgi:putative transcriptional regulator
MTKKTKRAPAKGNNQLTRELLEIARDMHASGIMPNAAYEKITMRHLGKTLTTPIKLSPKEIRALRLGAHLSQAVFAHFLNLTVGYVSQLERGEKRPTGAALALLNVIKRKGIEAIL